MNALSDAIEKKFQEFLKARFDLNERNLIKLENGYLVRFSSSEGISQIVLSVQYLGNRDNHDLVLCHGQLIKPNTEYIEFDNLLAFPKDEPLGEDCIPEDYIVENRGVLVTPEGETIKFEDKQSEFSSKKKSEFQKAGCSTCSESMDYHSLQIERKVKYNRCRLCTGVTLAAGFGLSLLFAWITTSTLVTIGFENLYVAVFGASLLFTFWRAYYWGYLPFQDILAKKIQIEKG